MIIKREEIEERIKQFNTSYFKKVHLLVAYKDKIYNELRCNSIRDKILNGTHKREECDDENVYHFLTLLHQNRRNDYCRFHREIHKYDWIKVMKKSK